MRLETRAYDDPDALKLITEVQQEYVRRYGSEDETPTDLSEFTPPLGHFLVGYLGSAPVACGGWRAHEGDEPGFRDGDAELKRMYVAPQARGRGLARLLLAALENAARDAGQLNMVLETGAEQPEAIGLYVSSGYVEIPKFGHYRCSPTSRCYGKPLHT